ncbi:MAG TPA: hypothetical protein PK440_11665 [Candidatus Accumulibacter phosphatis]|nr:hypothetical protein [Candidatus Accumulibacter phosphatis]HRQ95634.1 hypothetical protein [Candidatus Accumulibacter phosphatis]
MPQHAIPQTQSVGSTNGDQPVGEVPVLWQLPRMQRNALRKIFDRPDFTPSEVARLGRQRLERAEGIGRKGLATITEWLRRHGHEVAADGRGCLRAPDLAPVAQGTRKIEKAMRVLQSHGYTVVRSEESEDCRRTVQRTSSEIPDIPE